MISTTRTSTTRQSLRIDGQDYFLGLDGQLWFRGNGQHVVPAEEALQLLEHVDGDVAETWRLLIQASLDGMAQAKIRSERNARILIPHRKSRQRMNLVERI
ncbi:MAG: hypothetical protein AAF497_21680 [Planctomycetota bacterium]